MSGSTTGAAAPLRARGALACLWGLAAVFVVLGHDGRRVAQLLILFLPLMAWLAWPVRSAAVRRWRRVLAWAGFMCFALDGAARGFLLDAYQSAPDSSLVLGAAANTNARETGEYLQAHWRTLLLWLAGLAAAGAWSWRLAAQAGAQGTGRLSRGLVVLLAVGLLVGALGYASKPWRRLHPVVFWAGWSQSVQALRGTLGDQEAFRRAELARARAAAPSVAREGPSTVVMVLGDSVNRDNMSLYGYARPTTHRLETQVRQLGDQMLTLRHAWSADASTLPALRNIFGFGGPGRQDAPPHLLALARAAGYKVWWVSNHDDVAVEQTHARLADVVDFINRTPGRSTMSLDGELLDELQKALEDSAPRKLIVVHLLGTHPHYRLRFPADANPFDDAPDSVERELERQGRPYWVRRLRQDYDAAMLYHDFVVSETLALTRNAGGNPGYRAWMYLSDHGQEVGHATDHAGHSPGTAAGYRIPALLWSNDAPRPERAAIAARPFRGDWAGWTMASLLHLRWPGLQPARDVLAKDYVWQAPRLPIAISAYDR